jgi:MFS family permease
MNNPRRVLTILSLVIAGEAVFFLPFVMTRIFRPTFLSFYDVNNTQLGYFFSIYGVVALISYLFGGFLADRVQPRKLMTWGLILTALGGILILIFPYKALLSVVYGWWGFTSIFLFWAAMIRATREWGGKEFQGRAFGLLEGGRGATAALLGTTTFIIFTVFSVNTAPISENISAFHPFQYVVLATTFLTIVASVMVWNFVPESNLLLNKSKTMLSVKEFSLLIRKPGIWLLSIMIVCAYVGYKTTDDFSLYANEVLGYSEGNAAGLSTIALWLRAVVAIIAGFLGDRFSKKGLINWLFLISMVSGLLIFSGFWTTREVLILLNFVFVAIGIYGVRALYFAVFREAKVDMILTGGAVGLVSFIGYTPDIFMGPLMGVLLDNNPGEQGHRLVFLVLTAFSTVGWISSLIFNRLSENQKY